jgi:ADP-glucose pyrophosphorylase
MLAAQSLAADVTLATIQVPPDEVSRFAVEVDRDHRVNGFQEAEADGLRSP